MNKKRLIQITVFIAALTVGLLVLGFDTFTSANNDSMYENLKIFAEVLKEIQSNYVEKVDPKELIYSAVDGMVKSLDVHSAFLKKDEYKDLMDETKGEFTGVGIEITIKDGYVTVVSPIEDTPAFRAGIKSGDRIIKVNEVSTKDMGLSEVVKRIRGPKGTTVKLTIQREGEVNPLEFSLVRDKIPVNNVKVSYLGSGILYVRISNFQNQTAERLFSAVEEKSRSYKLEGMVLDLRNNPGGLLSEAAKVSDLFLDKGIIVSTKGREGTKGMEIKARSDDPNIPYSLVVLINEGSASASEIVAGALQDNKRALVVGTKSFGKGSVQTVIPLSDGSGLRLTTALYYTPSGRSIQVTGIEPDIVVPFYRASQGEEHKGQKIIREEDLKRHMEKKAEPKSPSVEKKATTDLPDAMGKELLEKDNQVAYAMGVLKGARLLPQGSVNVQ